MNIIVVEDVASDKLKLIGTPAKTTPNSDLRSQRIIILMLFAHHACFFYDRFE